MRVSTLRYDSGYTDKSWQYEVTLDGSKIDNCVTADEEKGYAEIYYLDSLGNMILDGDEIKTKKVCGEIKIKRI